MEKLNEIITELKRMHELKKNDIPAENLFKELGKYLYKELPLIRNGIGFSWFWKNKVIHASYGCTLNINKDGIMWFNYARLTLNMIISYLQEVSYRCKQAYYDDDELTKLEKLIYNISGEDKIEKSQI